jgi:hypothetical protein
MPILIVALFGSPAVSSALFGPSARWGEVVGESAVHCLEAVERDYTRHAFAAREFAREHLDSDRMLGRILRLVGL